MRPRIRGEQEWCSLSSRAYTIVAGLGSRRSGRGGDYTYDWIENLAGLDMHSADRIFPEFQDLAVGDPLALGARGPRLQARYSSPRIRWF